MKTTKKALFSSVVALVLCFSMFIGTTVAWFTDSVTSGVNKIVAGNLDIEVQFSKNGTGWTNLEGSQTLFSTEKWEPGHTEVVYLKVTNAGTLGLNYKVLVTPVNEKGGVNVNNQSFKLSDYLVFGTTAPSETLTTYTRDTARAAVGTGTGLADVNALTRSKKILAGGADQYLALVVYMPESVGNVANYKTGTEAPTIELGIKVVATQLGAETDSFGPDYDNGAVTDSFYTVGAFYNYFPQIAVSQPVAEGGDTTIIATGKLNNTDTTMAQVTVPAAAVKDGVTKLNFSVKPVDATNENALATIRTEVNAGREVANFDVKVEGIKDGNTSNISVEVFVGKGLNGVKVFHNGTEITGASYDASTGMVSFTTTSFSDFTVSYAPAVAAIGAQTYGTLELAVAAAQDSETITLLRDVVAEQPLEIKHSITLDGQGHSLTGPQGNSARVINVNDNTEHINLTLKNLDVVGPTSGTYTRGISAYNNKGLTLTVDHCSASANYYALNIAGANESVEVIVKNSTLNGWCAFQTWSAGTKATFENCTLIGTNDKSYNAEGWNDFATVIINENTTDVDLTFKNCRFEANQTTGNNQYLFSIRAAGAKVTMDGCTFFANGAEIAADELKNYISVYFSKALDFVMTIDGKTAVLVATEEELRTVLSAAGTGDYVYLAKNITLTSNLPISRDVTLVGNGNSTISGSPVYVGTNNTVTFKNVNFATPDNTNHNASSVYASGLEGKVVFDGCTFTNPQWECIQITPKDGAEIIVTNCSFIVDGSGTYAHGTKVERLLHIQNTAASGKYTAVITNNNFVGVDLCRNAVIDVDDIEAFANVTCGGNTFANHDNTPVTTLADGMIYVNINRLYDAANVATNTYAQFTQTPAAALHH